MRQHERRVVVIVPTTVLSISYRNSVIFGWAVRSAELLLFNVEVKRVLKMSKLPVSKRDDCQY
jgi:hypothetical protein